MLKNNETNTLTTSQILCRKPIVGDQDGMCGVCGVVGSGQHKRNDILQKTSANITALFPFNTMTICQWCRTLWEGGKVNPWNRALLATKKNIYFPLIAQSDLVSEERPLWRNVLKTLNPNIERVAILRTETKKRVWPKARVSKGDKIALYFHTDGFSETLYLSIKEINRQVDIIEPILEAGFSKFAIRKTLYKAKHKYSYNEILHWENVLQQIRNSQEFLPAVTIAQALSVSKDK